MIHHRYKTRKKRSLRSPCTLHQPLCSLVNCVGAKQKGTSPSDSNQMMKPCIDSVNYLYKLPIASTKALALLLYLILLGFSSLSGNFWLGFCILGRVWALSRGLMTVLVVKLG